MKKLMTLAIAALVVFPFLAFGQQTEGYYDRSFTRLSYVKGDVYIQRAQDLGYEQGEVNLVIVAGDKLGTRDGRTEIQLGRGNVLRLDLNTQIDVAGLPSRDGDPTKLHLINGSVYFRVREVDQEKNLQIHTPDASFYVLEPGLYRVDVRENRQTDFSVYSGRAEAAGEQGSALLQSGESVTAQNGVMNGEPAGLLARRDDFDSWNETRDGLYASRLSKTYLPATYSEYDYELSEYGNWSYESDYGYVWVPTVYDNWRPYSDGHWVWYPIIGWTWVSYEPWGWCTSHYGRWGWRGGLGWYWIPMSYWSWGPAWVHWYNNYDYIGWCPLSYWGYPAVIVNNVFYGQYNNGWYDGGAYGSYANSLTVVRRDQLQNRHLSEVALNGRSGVDFGRINLRAAQPDLRPAIDRNPDLVNRARSVLDRASLRSVGRDFSSRSVARPSSGRNDARTLSRDGNALDRRSVREPALSGRTDNRENMSPSRRVVERAIRPQSDRALSRPSSQAGTSSSRLSAPTVRERSTSSRTIRERPSIAAPTTRSSSSTIRSTQRSTSSPTIRERQSASVPTTRSSSSTIRSTQRSTSSPTIRERQSAAAPTTRSSSSSSRLNAPTRSSSSTIRERLAVAPTTRSSSSSARSYSAPSRSASSSRSYSTPSRSSSSSSRTYSQPSRSSSPSRSYSAPSRSSSSARSYSAPSRPSSSSRSYSAPSRSTSSSRSSGSVSRSSSSSSRSSSSSSSSRSSSRSSGSSRSSSGRRR